MKVLVIGATGLLGANICEALVMVGHDVRGLKRASSRTANVADLPVEFAVGDVRDPGSLVSAMAGCEAVIHAAGAYTGHYRRVEWAREVGRMNAMNVKHACLQAGVRRAIFISSYATIAHPRRGEAASEVPAVPASHHPRNPYVQMKLEMERVWLEPAAGLEVVVTIPLGVWGPRDSGKSTGPLIRAIVTRQLPVMIDGAVNIVDARDCARAHALALEKGRPGERYLIVGHDTGMGAVSRKVAAIAGVKPPLVLPRPVIPPVVGLLESAGPAFNRLMPALPLAFFAFGLAYSHRFDGSKAAGELGFAPQYALDDTLHEAVACVQADLKRRSEGIR